MPECKNGCGRECYENEEYCLNCLAAEEYDSSPAARGEYPEFLDRDDEYVD